jgi:hypothetical protein
MGLDLSKSDAELMISPESEVQKRVPKTGAFNEVTIGAMTSTVFGFIGYWGGKVLGKLADDTPTKEGKESGKITPRGSERFGKWAGAVTLGLLGASVGIRHAREAREQAEVLARKSVELEQVNQALAASYGQPVGSLVTPEQSTTPGTTVEMAKTEGLLQESKEIAKEL